MWFSLNSSERYFEKRGGFHLRFTLCNKTAVLGMELRGGASRRPENQTMAKSQQVKC
jgi:hypothetical protein